DCGRTSTLRRNDAIALLVRNFKPRPVFGVHTLSPEWEASLCSTEAEHITACCSIHPLEAACLRFTTHCSRIIPYGIFGAGRGPRQQLDIFLVEFLLIQVILHFHQGFAH